MEGIEDISAPQLDWPVPMTKLGRHASRANPVVACIVELTRMITLISLIDMIAMNTTSFFVDSMVFERMGCFLMILRPYVTMHSYALWYICYIFTGVACHIPHLSVPYTPPYLAGFFIYRSVETSSFNIRLSRLHRLLRIPL
jgi:hypothetical protein